MTENFLIINSTKLTFPTNLFTILQQCEILGIRVPRFCYHEKLSIAGNCRICLVEVSNSFKLVVACATMISKNITINTMSNIVKNSRENILEMLLINHPLDCPICDQGGECDLQDQAILYGKDRSKFKEIKRSVFDKNLSPFIKTIMTRCIHCTRCIRYFNEVVGYKFIGTLGRGSQMEISNYVYTYDTTELSGNVVDLCPVGALTSKPFAFSARP
jgi:NADH dehydrogenase/NADH:ubiquinone oxidoreductase subunit G